MLSFVRTVVCPRSAVTLRLFSSSASRYTKSDEWIRVDDAAKKLATVGISKFASDTLNGVANVDLPAVGTKVSQGKEFGVIENVKTTASLYAPASGKIVAINKAAVDDNSLIDTAPETEGWLIQIQLDNEKELESLLDAKAYAKAVEDKKH
ncbi:mitochondrial glycine cleavage system lipoamide protein (H-protein GcsH) [Andalucia godoyi]|uniref:Glycine cleavage system H protein n=1 Tax=Andalucia godoyi TaxID=505711 RepID=A0A8K0F2N5_ANDGO|nr:mitochondrial glycine cleavage system lipoamide protein (H-protein GcsH) [Andalucia godoyi]|eukprot:ANDGO_06476.mRNA.1 mitochondrial glycine cleavage system lipoamide protein (H-protein GcsH)